MNKCRLFVQANGFLYIYGHRCQQRRKHKYISIENANENIDSSKENKTNEIQENQPNILFSFVRYDLFIVATSTHTYLFESVIRWVCYFVFLVQFGY